MSGCSVIHTATLQKILNQIPPFDTLVIPFAGHCAVTRAIRPSQNLMLFDRDPDVVDWWCQRFWPHTANLEGPTPKQVSAVWNCLPGMTDETGNPKQAFHSISVQNTCGIGGLAGILGMASIMNFGQIVAYLDPPYPVSTRKSDKTYPHDMTDEQHLELLDVIRHVQPVTAKLIVSSYPNDMYSESLQHWRTFKFRARTRGSDAIEQVWCNFPEPEELHDYRHHGKNKRERFKFHRRRTNLLNKIRALPVRERNDMLWFLWSEFGEGGQR